MVTPCLITGDDVVQETHLQLCNSLAGPDRLAFSGLYVPVWASLGPTWHKLCDTPTLPTWFPMHWSPHSAPYKVPWS
jgi:hypothetical protein